jgi:hypothetical protein
MNNCWGKGNLSFEEMRGRSYLFANSCFVLVNKIDTSDIHLVCIELMSHAPKILRLIDGIENESDLSKFKSALLLAKSESHFSVLGLIELYRDSEHKTEIDKAVQVGQDLINRYSDLIKLRSEF